MMKTIALLPMKENSERVPNKNIRLLGDKPLFFHIADEILKTGLFDALCINTDSKKITDLARERYPDNWLIIHERPQELCGDEVPMNDILAHDLRVLGANNMYLQTHSTNPFVTDDTLVSAHEKFTNDINANYDSLFSVTQHQARFFDSFFQPINHDSCKLLRTQDLSPIYEENSCFYFFTTESFNKTQARIGDHPSHFVIRAGDMEFMDIDTEEQWALAASIIDSKSLEVL